MNREAMEAWVAALEDPANEKRQIRGSFSNEKGGVCAVGLAMEVFGETNAREVVLTLAGSDYLRDQHEVLRVNVNDRHSTSVVLANDTFRWSFWDIAQALRATHLKEIT